MEVFLTPQEQTNLTTEAAKRGVSVQALLDLAARRARRGVKSNGWCSRMAEFMNSAGETVAEEPSKPRRGRRPKIY